MQAICIYRPDGVVIVLVLSADEHACPSQTSALFGPSLADVRRKPDADEQTLRSVTHYLAFFVVSMYSLAITFIAVGEAGLAQCIVVIRFVWRSAELQHRDWLQADADPIPTSHQYLLLRLAELCWVRDT